MIIWKKPICGLPERRKRTMNRANTLEKAKEILDTHPEQSIQQISVSVGYDDAYHFSKLFKKHYGISPLYYRTSKD